VLVFQTGLSEKKKKPSEIALQQLFVVTSSLVTKEKKVSIVRKDVMSHIFYYLSPWSRVVIALSIKPLPSDETACGHIALCTTKLVMFF